VEEAVEEEVLVWVGLVGVGVAVVGVGRWVMGGLVLKEEPRRAVVG
jgi:hypothetical protein